ncbi:hypothetical protein Q9S36_43570 [Microbacterium sp. ARD31]|uniref:hypothetical protein n=1 Tax=Microbacterium sp. ARD31 TaxID=2962576 RepID=UPI002881B333|nr:hypothetical protein [Microbacterium sp. ARD31]MDT0187087.1 hypothetical protein [Microbacterium sp. ARD31]
MIEPMPEISGRGSADPRVIARAEALRRLPSTRSDLADELDRGLGLAREGDPAAARVLAAAVDAVANFRHIIPDDGGFALSLYARGLLDSAYWALESPSTPPSVAARIRDAQHLIEQGDEHGIAALQAALSPEQ